jgi:hypothetical protein
VKDRSVHRILGIVGSFLVCGGLIVWGFTATVGAAALDQGIGLYRYRNLLDAFLRESGPAARPLVVWLGDSTIMAFRRKSYPQLLRPRLLEQGVDSRVIALPGMDAYAHYFLSGRVLELDPVMVVIVAHLPGFLPKGSKRTFTYNDTCSYLLPSQLPGTFLLPLAERQLSPARVLLAQSLNFEIPKRIFYTAEGARLLYQRAPFWSALGPPRPPAFFDPSALRALGGYNVELSRRQPTVRMLEATVRAVTEAGRVALVVAAPIPHEAMQQEPWYDAARIQRRIDVLRDATRDAGGTFVDLHQLLRRVEFADFGGHLTPDGALRVSNMVWPFVREGVRRAARSSRPPAGHGGGPRTSAE